MKSYERADSPERTFVRKTWAGLSIERELLFAQVVHDHGYTTLSSIEAEVNRREEAGEAS